MCPMLVEGLVSGNLSIVESSREPHDREGALFQPTKAIVGATLEAQLQAGVMVGQDQDKWADT